MLQAIVDNALVVAKESVKTITYEFLNNIVRFINGVSALVLAFLPGKASILEGMQGWELRPAFRAPWLPNWMENGASSFNKFIHEFSLDVDSSISEGYVSGDEDNSDITCPVSPLSQRSNLSCGNSFLKQDKRHNYFIRFFLAWLLYPVTVVWKLFFSRHPSSLSWRCKAFRANLESDRGITTKPNTTKNHVVPRTIGRRRGIIEDIQLGVEIVIESIFEVFHKAARYILSPWMSCQGFWHWLFTHKDGVQGSSDNVSVSTTSLGDDNPTLREKPVPFSRSLNTDTRTCKDVITDLGYPYEAIQVVTSDGYILLLERIPRRDARKVAYLQHGILDTSLGWVSNGVVGSPAFAAFDHGYDVFLGNLRGLVSREHVDKNISSRRYWKYSLNEHAIYDIPAMFEKIHEVKLSELVNYPFNVDDDSDDQPYRLCAICHSLGGAVMLMYLVIHKIQEKPHRLSRLVLLSPAGFHEDSSIFFTLVEKMMLLLVPILAPLLPGIYIPTRFFRMLLNKLAKDLENYPALGGLVQTLMSYVVGGDSSNWVGVIAVPHYNMNDMPGVSIYVAHHLAQIKHAKRFLLYNYGSSKANLNVYGSPSPLDVGQHYGLIDIPIDLVAGRKDKVIRRSMVQKHYHLMKNEGVDVSYKEFEYAHLDFTFSHREELLSYVISRLLLVSPPSKRSQRPGFRRKPSKIP